MKRVLRLLVVLVAALLVALVLRVRYLHGAAHGPAGGTGVIEGVDVNVTSRIATRVAKVNVREGDNVHQGDVLVELDCAETTASLDEALARLRVAERSSAASHSSAQSAGSSAAAALDGVSAADSQVAALAAQETLVRTELERDEALLRQGAVSRSTVDDARARRETLVSQIAAQRANAGASREQASASSGSGKAAWAQALAARSNIDVARASAARSEVAVRECKLTAPREGTVASRNFEPGEAVAPGSIILVLTDVSEARTRFYLPNDQLAAAAPGRKVRVVADAYPGQTFEGTIFHVSPRAEFTPRNVQTRDDRARLVYAVEVRIPNPDMRLRSGMPVEVSIEGSAR
jgi:HlyD family secretion protein